MIYDSKSFFIFIVILLFQLPFTIYQYAVESITQDLEPSEHEQNGEHGIALTFTSLSLSLSLSLSFSPLLLSLFHYLSLSLSVCLSVSLPLCLSASLCLSLFVCLYLSFSHSSLFLSFSLSLFLNLLPLFYLSPTELAQSLTHRIKQLILIIS